MPAQLDEKRLAARQTSTRESVDMDKSDALNMAASGAAIGSVSVGIAATLMASGPVLAVAVGLGAVAAGAETASRYLQLKDAKRAQSASVVRPLIMNDAYRNAAIAKMENLISQLSTKAQIAKGELADGRTANACCTFAAILADIESLSPVVTELYDDCELAAVDNVENVAKRLDDPGSF